MAKVTIKKEDLELIVSGGRWVQPGRWQSCARGGGACPGLGVHGGVATLPPPRFSGTPHR